MRECAEIEFFFNDTEIDALYDYIRMIRAAVQCSIILNVSAPHSHFQYVSK